MRDPRCGLLRADAQPEPRARRGKQPRVVREPPERTGLTESGREGVRMLHHGVRGREPAGAETANQMIRAGNALVMLPRPRHDVFGDESGVIRIAYKVLEPGC